MDISKEAASCKQQAASLTRRDYRIIKDDMQTKEALKIIGGSTEQTVKNAGLVDRFTCQGMQDWRQAPEGAGQQSAYDCYALKGCYVFKVVQDAQYQEAGSYQASGLGPGNGTLDQQ